MTAMELDSRRMELIRKIMETDSIEVLDIVKQAFNRAVKTVQPNEAEPIDGIPCFLEDVKQDIAVFESELDRGILETIPHAEVMKEMRHILSSL